LELAVRGKLVPQDPNDEPASILLKKIAAEKARLIKEGKLRKQAPLPETADNEKLFGLPNGWVWSRLGDIGIIFNGNSINEEIKEEKYTGINGGLPFIATKDVGYGWDALDYNNGILIPEDEPRFKVAHKGAVLICAEGGSAGKKCGITNQDICFGNKLFAIELYGNLYSSYILANYLCPSFYSHFTQKMTGIIGGVSTTKFSQLLVPIPPAAEQHRIVAKVDELMAMCDQLEQQQTGSNAAHQTLVETLLATLTNVANQDEFVEAWQRIANHFDILFATKQSIDQLKQTILQLAVMGKLVPQDPNDEPASILLKKIATEKSRLIKEGKIKKQEPLTEISEDEKLFVLPKGWEWSRLQTIIDVRDGTHDSPKDAIGSDTYPLVTSKNFCNGMIKFDEARRISSEDHLEISKRSLVEKYDILFSMIGGNLGNQVMVDDDRPFSVKNVALFKYYNKKLTSPFFIKTFMEHLALDLQSKAAGGAQPFVSLGFLRNLVIAVPPTEEQHRIVAKVDELMTLCDTLKTHINDAQTTQIQLADAIVEQAVD
jgi:type I restriction enzyme S subunit